MGKNDESYERGVRDGQRGTLSDDVSQSISKGFSSTDSERTYDKGYSYGADHRYGSEGRYHSHDGTGSNDGGSSSSSGGSDKGGCFLTSACVNARSLPDDCLELSVLRDFREKRMLQSPAGRSALKEYARFAPSIVAAIDEQEDSASIWDRVYQDITQAVSLVLSGKHEQAFEHYCQMATGLRDKYL